ncbi:mucin-2 isoform X1 [Cherax quadricarinatus]|uniref:mucin-2 isoform X1 n=1 Tax=Cherax quadricarinatus TaxID=27406 RepID=UPI00237854B7|nr:uncharacterized protein LOC128704106 isoform X1 [Cherax quadricarinatus]XP_053655110.1 uncharacterized protein LOC128704106 isoform X1 [Cherax quadricarinatus]
MITLWFLCVVSGLGVSQHLNRIPAAQVSITNPGERGLIPAQPYSPPTPSTTPPTPPTPPPASPHTHAHLNEIESGVYVQDHGYRRAPAGATTVLPSLVLDALTLLTSSPRQIQDAAAINQDDNTDGEVSQFGSASPSLVSGNKQKQQQTSNKNLSSTPQTPHTRPVPVPVDTHLSVPVTHNGILSSNLPIAEFTDEGHQSSETPDHESVHLESPINNHKHPQEPKLLQKEHTQTVKEVEEAARRENLRAPLMSDKVTTELSVVTTTPHQPVGVTNNVNVTQAKPPGQVLQPRLTYYQTISGNTSQLSTPTLPSPHYDHQRAHQSGFLQPQLDFTERNLPLTKYFETTAIPTRDQGRAVLHTLPPSPSGKPPPVHHRGILPLAPPSSAYHIFPVSRLPIPTHHRALYPFYTLHYPFSAFQSPVIGPRLPIPLKEEADVLGPPPRLYYLPQYSIQRPLPQQLHKHAHFTPRPQLYTQSPLPENKLLPSQLVTPYTSAHSPHTSLVSQADLHDQPVSTFSPEVTPSTNDPTGTQHIPRRDDINRPGQLSFYDQRQFDKFAQVFERLNQNIKINSSRNNPINDNDYDYDDYYDYDYYDEYPETDGEHSYPETLGVKHPESFITTGKHTSTLPIKLHSRPEQPHTSPNPTTRVRTRFREPITPPPSFIPPRAGHTSAGQHLYPPSMKINHHLQEHQQHSGEVKSLPTSRPLASPLTLHTNKTQSFSTEDDFMQDALLTSLELPSPGPLNHIHSIPLHKSGNPSLEGPTRHSPTSPSTSPPVISTTTTTIKNIRVQTTQRPTSKTSLVHSQESEGKITVDERAQLSPSDPSVSQKGVTSRRRPVGIEIGTIIGAGGHTTLLASPEQLLKLHASTGGTRHPSKPRQPVYFLPTEAREKRKSNQHKREVNKEAGTSQQDISRPNMSRKRLGQRPQMNNDQNSTVNLKVKLIEPHKTERLPDATYAQHLNISHTYTADAEHLHNKTDTIIHHPGGYHANVYQQQQLLQQTTSKKTESTVKDKVESPYHISLVTTRSSVTASPTQLIKTHVLSHTSPSNVAGGAFYRLPLLGLTGKQALTTFKDQQNDHTTLPSLLSDNLPDVLHKAVTAFPPFQKDSVSIGEDGMLRVAGWRKDLPYPSLNISASSPALSGLPFYLAQHRHLGPFFMVSL